MINRPEHEKGWQNYLFGKAFSNIAWWFMGGICGTSFFALKIGNVIWAGLITFGLMLLKESIDEFTSYFEWCTGKWGLDAAGGDLRDVLLGVIGIVSAILCI